MLFTLVELKYKMGKHFPSTLIWHDMIHTRQYKGILGHFATIYDLMMFESFRIILICVKLSTFPSTWLIITNDIPFSLLFFFVFCFIKIINYNNNHWVTIPLCHRSYKHFCLHRNGYITIVISQNQHKPNHNNTPKTKRKTFARKQKWNGNELINRWERLKIKMITCAHSIRNNFIQYNFNMENKRNKQKKQLAVIFVNKTHEQFVTSWRLLIWPFFSYSLLLSFIRIF